VSGGFLAQAFVYLGAAVITVPLARRLGLGSVLGYLIAGALVGPWGLGLVGSEGQDVMHVAEFGVVMMLFVVGLELQPALLWRMRTDILGLGGLQVVLTALAVAAAGLALGLDPRTGLAAGLVLAMSSTAIVIQSLEERGLMRTRGGEQCFSVLLFQDMAVIPILALLPLLAIAPAGAPAGEHGTAWVDQLPLWGRSLAVVGGVGAIVLGGRTLVGPAFRLVARSGIREIFTAAALLLVVGIALLMGQLGLSPALGTFLAGVVLAQSEYRHELETDIEPFKGLLLGLFFLAVGATIDFGMILDRPGLILALVLGLVVLKFLVLLVAGRLLGNRMEHSLLAGLALAQGGEFAFVLFSFARQQGVLEPALVDPLVAAVALSMAVAPLLFVVHAKWVLPRFAGGGGASRPEDDIDRELPVIIAGFGRVGSTVGRFLQANGIQATYLDLDPDNVDLLRRLGLKVYYGDASRVDLLHAAGAGRARLLIVAVDQPDKTLELVRTVRRHFPGLPMLVRTHGWRDSYAVLDEGVAGVYRETLDSALRLGTDALAALGVPHYQAVRARRSFRRHDERNLRELATLRHDADRLLEGARQRITDLEQRIKAEEDGLAREKDLGWDAQSLIEEFGALQKAAREAAAREKGSS
jgi:monovalent cation:proton antiporter-2 (CPA2) family protein